MPQWMVVSVAVALGLEAIVVFLVIDDRVMDWFLRHGRNRPGLTAVLAVGTHLPFLLLWGALWLLVDARGPDSALRWLGVPLMAVHVPYVACFVPSEFTLYRHHHDDLRQRGASPATSRALFWTSAPFAVAGLVISVAVFFWLFVE